MLWGNAAGRAQRVSSRCAAEGGAEVRGPPEGEEPGRVCAGGRCGCHWGMGAVGSGACWVCRAADGRA